MWVIPRLAPSPLGPPAAPRCTNADLWRIRRPCKRPWPFEGISRNPLELRLPTSELLNERPEDSGAPDLFRDPLNHKAGWAPAPPSRPICKCAGHAGLQAQKAQLWRPYPELPDPQIGKEGTLTPAYIWLVVFGKEKLILNFVSSSLQISGDRPRLVSACTTWRQGDGALEVVISWGQGQVPSPLRKGR